jgi:uncharacterized damage-inducible protein DinB
VSVFTNASSGAAGGGAAYTRALLELLGDRDARAVMREQTGWLRAALADHPRAALVRPERAGKWSVVQVLRHLADTELISGYRMRKAVAESGYGIVSYDQDRWADGLRYADADPAAALEDIASLRALNLRWLDGLSAEELERYGDHPERGRESVGHMMTMMGAHDLLHRAQITRILASDGR